LTNGDVAKVPHHGYFWAAELAGVTGIFYLNRVSDVTVVLLTADLLPTRETSVEVEAVLENVGSVGYHHGGVSSVPQNLRYYNLVRRKGRPFEVGEDKAPGEELGAVRDCGERAAIGSVEDH